MWAVPHLCKFYPGICLTTEQKAWNNLSQGKKDLTQGTVYILPKHPHIANLHKQTHMHAHTHITKQYTVEPRFIVFQGVGENKR